ncbi:hypothetical protein [Massilia sp.]|uniref:hypothetical protein n=1 Tax=Massilia sp. TaxID=1882437 RepID=UPI0028AEEBE7|nr:hypothetical protein [Massilia sp.]
MMTEQKQALWDRFCAEHRIVEASVPLFLCDDNGRAASVPFGKDGRLILRRSPEMEALIVREVGKTLSIDTRNEGILYMMHWQDAGRVTPLYIGRAGKYGKGGGNISANLRDIERDTSKFARWGSGYAYHIGDLSAAACTGHGSDKLVKKYCRWAQRLFLDAPAPTPTLRRPVYFWATAWSADSYSIWSEFGSCFLAFQEYLLIGVAAQLFPDSLLNDEGVNRSASTFVASPSGMEQ